jgi:hypothetical protein
MRAFCCNPRCSKDISDQGSVRACDTSDTSWPRHTSIKPPALAKCSVYFMKGEIEEMIDDFKHTDKAEAHAKALKAGGNRDEGYG